jgi:hypothetical protein
MGSWPVGDHAKEKDKENDGRRQGKGVSEAEGLTSFPDAWWCRRRYGYRGLGRYGFGRGQHGGHETISLASYGLDEAGVIAIVPERLADFADSTVDTVVGVEVDIRSPDSFDDLVAGDKLPGMLGEKEKQLQRNAFQLDRASGATKFVRSGIKLEVAKSDGLLDGELPGHYITPQGRVGYFTTLQPVQMSREGTRGLRRHRRVSWSYPDSHQNMKN